MRDDIYEILRHHDKATRLLKQIEDNEIALASIMARAADEIEELRHQNKNLKKELEKYES